jgi:predicted P-loop ATPase
MAPNKGPTGPGLVLVTSSPSADEHTKAETAHKRALFEWADSVLKQIGVTAKIKQAMTFDDLRKITFDVDDFDVELAICDALHPSSGQKAGHFTGMHEGSLKRLLKNRFGEKKKEREFDLRKGTAGGAKQSTYNWADDLKIDRKGGVRPILANLILFLRHHPKGAGVLAYNEFTSRVVINKQPPWGKVAPDAVWTDHYESLVRIWFQNEDINANLGDVGRAVQVAAHANSFHPVRDYFNGLVWDGALRLDAWLTTYLHADDSDYARAVGSRFLISAVARIFDPGCQVDHVLTLEGPQGKLKSTALRTLAVKDAWFTDRLSHVSNKDAAMEISGVLLIEVAEMDALTRASSNSTKAFITRRVDRFRPPHGKHPINLQRQCVFAGTINPVVGGYLKDSTGSRRIWPVACNGTIDVEALARDVDQIWAEAVARFKAGAKWWLETPELEALATAEQALRFKRDVWTDQVEKWLGKKTDVSIPEVLKGALGIAPQDQKQVAMNRVASILTNLKFSKHRPRKGDDRSYRYSRD